MKVLSAIVPLFFLDQVDRLPFLKSDDRFLPFRTASLLSITQPLALALHPDRRDVQNFDVEDRLDGPTDLDLVTLDGDLERKRGAGVL